MEVAAQADAYRCATCTWGKHCGPENPAPLEQWILSVPLEDEIFEWKSRTCPLPMITPQSHFLLRLHRHYSAGHLALAGGWLDQPAYYTEAMTFIGLQFDRVHAEQAERQRQGQ